MCSCCESSSHKKCEDTKVVPRSLKSKKDRQYNGQKKKGQTMTYKT